MNRRQSCRGQMLVMFAVMMPLFLGFAGFAVDITYAFMVKASLVTATDSAALAGSRAIPSLSTDPMAVTNAVDRTFKANMPPNHLATGVPVYSSTDLVAPTVEADGSRSISIVGTAQAPTFFLHLFGIHNFAVKAFAKGVRHDVNVVLVLDHSGSLVPAWSSVRDGAKFFVDQFDNDRDRIGLVSFGTSAALEYTPKTNFESDLLNKLNAMPTPHSSNHTNSALGLYKAYAALKGLAANSQDNVIVFFTDGVATAFPGQFDVRTAGKPHCASTPRDGIYSSQNSGGSVLGLFRQDKPDPGSYPDPDYLAFTDCYNSSGTGSGSYYDDSLLTGAFRATWQPPVGPSVPLTGLNSVNLSNTNDGPTVSKISENMLLNVARVARQDALRIRILVIGLGGTEPPDEEVLKRVANVAPYAVGTEPVGLEIFAPNSSALMEAFRQVASSISRLGR